MLFVPQVLHQDVRPEDMEGDFRYYFRKPYIINCIHLSLLFLYMDNYELKEMLKILK